LLDVEQIKNLLDLYEPMVKDERERLDAIKAYMEGKHRGPYRPPKSETDVQYDLLAQRSIINLLPMIRNASAQQLEIAGVSTNTGDSDIKAWQLWQSNDFDNRHVQIISSALTYGSSYAYAIRDAKNDIVMRGVSSRHMFALYRDPVADEYPEYAFRVSEAGTITEVWDEDEIYEISHSQQMNSEGGTSRLVDIKASYRHGSVVCPVVRFAPTMDLDGNCIGEIEPVIVLQDRLNQVSFDLLLTQHYTAFRIMGISGVKEVKDKITGKSVPVKLGPDTVAVLADNDSKAWSIPGSELGGIIQALKEAIHHMAIASQTPAHYMLGDMVNLSAEALAAAEATLTRKVTTYKLTLGESFEQLLTLTSSLTGEKFPEDAEVMWSNRASRSEAQVADALTKYFTFGVPEEGLWEMIPGVTKTQLIHWKELKAAEPPEITPVIQPGS
jgi:hypothetical protein